MQWLLDQQCVGGSTPAAAEGGWQGYRASPGGVLDACVDPTIPSTASTAPTRTAPRSALQALAAVGDSTANAGGTTFLPEHPGHHGCDRWWLCLPARRLAGSNSTAVVIQTIVALGDSPTGSSWTAGVATPLAALSSFVSDDGRRRRCAQLQLQSWSGRLPGHLPGGVGLHPDRLPFAQVAPVVPTTTSTSTPNSAPTDNGAAQAVSASPAFTG